jgi:hypothetical protein
MKRASYVSVQLARFDTLRPAGEFDAAGRAGVLFCGVAADTRAAATEPSSQQAFKFLILGLHEDSASAHRLLEDRQTLAPWLSEAREVWAGVLQPFRHKGEANYLDPAQPGPLFDTLAPSPNKSDPLVILTSVGWNTGDGFDRNRVMEFSTGVGGVRTSMTAVPGLHSQQSFSFPGVLHYDPVTVTFWKDDASVLAFAYGPGVHRAQMDRYRAENLADRTSFTRYIVHHSEGTWHGSDPLSTG